MTTHDGRFDPDLPPEEFRRLGYRAIDMLAEYFDTIEDRRVYPEADPETIAWSFDEPVPETGQDPDDILDEWRDGVLAHAAFNTSPRFFAFVMGSGSMMGVTAEALETGPESAGPRLDRHLDELNQGVVDEVLQSGEASPTTTLIRGNRTSRMSICSFRTTADDVDRTFDALAETGAGLDEEWRERASLPV